MANQKRLAAIVELDEGRYAAAQAAELLGLPVPHVDSPQSRDPNLPGGPQNGAGHQCLIFSRKAWWSYLGL